MRMRSAQRSARYKIAGSRVKPIEVQKIKMELLKGPLQFFFPEDCYEEVIVNHNIFNGDNNNIYVTSVVVETFVVFGPMLAGRCLSLANSRFLSLTIILGSVLVKVPQILKCLKAGSVENLSYTATILELSAATFTCAYNYNKGFPFSSWGESLFITLQVVILLAIMFYYNSQSSLLMVFMPVYAGVVWYLSSGLATIELLGTLQTSVIPMMLLSRLSQVVTTFQNKTTGQLSLITSVMNWLGTGARIFTTLQETQDLIILANFVTSFAMNTIILAQFLCYPAKAAEVKKQS